MLRRIVFALCTAVASLVLFATGASAEGCPNEAVRQEQHAAYLPDCRAYEQVSPVEKNGVDVSNNWGQLSSADGTHFAFGAFGGFGDTRSAPLITPYVATRSAAGWEIHSASAPVKPGTFEPLESIMQYSSDFTKSILSYGEGADPGLVPGVSSGPTLYESAVGADQYQLVANDPLGDFQFASLTSVAANSDLSRVLFTSPHSLIPGVPDPPRVSITDAGFQLYEWDSGALRLASVEPDGTPAPPIDYAGLSYQVAASTDGTGYAYRAGEHVYVTDHGTTRVLAPSFVADTYIRATPDLSHVFVFALDSSNLPLATWDYDTASGQLTSLPVQASTLGQGAFQGVSDDGSWLYVETPAQLVPGTGTAGGANLYALHDGAADYVGSGGGVAVTPDGHHFVFSSSDPLTGYDAGGHSEFFEYDALTQHVSCLSCSPTGAPATGDAIVGWPRGVAAGTSPAGHHDLTTDGHRFFFTSPDALVPQDVNGKGHYDAYMNENGKISLLSSGRGESSYFTDASANGNDVFIATRERLTATDTDNNIDIYDARVDGGFPGGAGQPTCAGDECQGQPSAPPTLALVGSVTFNGSGNVPGVAGPVSTTPLTVFRTGVITGASAVLRVTVRAKGRLTLSGAGVRATAKSLASAGVTTITVFLTHTARSTLKRKHILRTTVRIAFMPAAGTLASANVSLTFRSASTRKGR